jgi:hypothetical protein
VGDLGYDPVMSRPGRLGLFLVGVAVLGSACGPAMVWRKPGASEAEAQADERDCDTRAGASRVSPLSSSSSVGSYGGGSGGPLGLRPYALDTEGTASLQAFWACMEDRGYRQVPPSGG